MMYNKKRGTSTRRHPSHVVGDDRTPLPAALAAVFQDARRIDRLIGLLRELANEIEQLATRPGGEVLASRMVVVCWQLARLTEILGAGRPQAVCPDHAAAGCKLCSGRGWLAACEVDELPADVRARVRVTQGAA